MHEIIDVDIKSIMNFCITQNTEDIFGVFWNRNIYCILNHRQTISYILCIYVLLL